MTVWMAIAATAAIVVAALLLPLFGRTGGKLSRRERELAIYKDQLGELERERAAGRIAAAEADAAATEIQRKILASAALTDRADEGSDPATATRVRLAAVLAVGSLGPVGALLVYLSVGSPTAPAHPFDPSRRAQAQAPADPAAHGNAEIEAMIATLADRMKQDPNNLEGWILLARSYSAVKRHGEAAQAYERVYALSKNSITYAGDYGEALVLAASGEVVPTAHDLFKQVAAHDPGEPRARYYLALALAQSGKPRDAIAMWRGLEADSPPDAPWLPALREVMQIVAQEAGIDAASVAPAARAPIKEEPGPTTEDVAAAQAMTPDDQQQMIEEMVARLAERLENEPTDIDGWLRLARSYAVLGKQDLAAQALRRAAAVTEAPAELKEQVAAAAQELGVDVGATGTATAPSPIPAAPDSTEDQGAMIQAMVDGLAQRLQSNPNDIEGWKRLGRSYLVLNEPQRAQEAYGRAMTLAPTDVGVLTGYANATMLTPGAITVPKESVETLRGLLASGGSDPAALWLLGIAEAEAGNNAQATTLLKRLLDQLPPDAAAYRTVRDRLAQVTPAP